MYIYIITPISSKEYRVNSETITIGRSLDSNIVIKDPKVSKQHLSLSFQKNGTVIATDLRTKNGTRIKNEMIETREIYPKEALEFGDCVLVLSDKRLDESELNTFNIFPRLAID